MVKCGGDDAAGVDLRDTVGANAGTGDVEVAPDVVEVEVAVPRLRLTEW
jgi:hypothetical protein